MLLPDPRGPLSAAACAAVRGRPTVLESIDVEDALVDDDLHLALWICYELSFQGFDDVDDDLEFDADVLRLRGQLERQFLAALIEQVEVPTAGTVAERLVALTSVDTGPSLSRFLQSRADLAQFREFVAHRSVYHLKEADPHTFAIPRLRGASKAAMVEIQSDEYGGGRVARMHSQLFADTMTGLGLDTSYGTYVASAPGVTLATNNVMSLFGLHRRWRGAAAGHLASIEMTSSLPNRRYARGLRRLGGSDRACRFYDEHVEADAVHEQIAVHDLCAALALDDPAVAEDIVFGAAAALALDVRFAEHVLGAWREGRSSLRSTSPVFVAA